MKRMKKERGVLTLEASICVTIFIFLMLFLYSFFVVFETRNEMAHVLLATTNSLSLDPYESGKFSNAGDISNLIYRLYDLTTPDDVGFVSQKDWSNMPGFGFDETTWSGTIYVEGSDQSLLEEDDFGNSAATSSMLGTAIKDRFLAYLAGGSTDEANKLLEHYNIVGGWDGLDFSGSKIASGSVTIIVRYTLEYEFNMFGLGTIEMEQSACSKLWK